jgi:hypothetical protein
VALKNNIYGVCATIFLSSQALQSPILGCITKWESVDLGGQWCARLRMFQYWHFATRDVPSWWTRSSWSNTSWCALHITSLLSMFILLWWSQLTKGLLNKDLMNTLKEHFLPLLVLCVWCQHKYQFMRVDVYMYVERCNIWWCWIYQSKISFAVFLLWAEVPGVAAGTFG